MDLKPRTRVVDPRNGSVYTARVVRARRDRPCSFCETTVRKGEQYGRTRDFHSSRDFDFSVCRAHSKGD